MSFLLKFRIRIAFHDPSPTRNAAEKHVFRINAIRNRLKSNFIFGYNNYGMGWKRHYRIWQKIYISNSVHLG